MISRWRRTSWVRTAGTAATAETAPVTSGPRMAASTSVPFARKCGASGSVPMSRVVSWAIFAIASGFCRSAPACWTAQVTARYIAPVSR
jgi:hypothetical protein